MPGRSSSEAAAREAYEEAGVSGEIASKPIGAFSYVKRRKSGERTCRVEVFALCVRAQSGTWPERGQRDLKWLAAIDAASTVSDSGLGELILRFVDAVGP
jgi:8-oxo-dGTP pyrophosphatase MutT (NUDIX family)